MLALTYSLADQNFFTTKSVGIFNFSVQLLEALAEPAGDLDLAVLTNSTLTARLKLPPPITTQLHDEAIGGRLRRMLWDQSGVYRAAKKQKKPWLFLPKGFASFARNCPVNLAAYVHDTILDSYYGRHGGVFVLERLYFGLCLGATLKHARLIFTNSDFTCRELTRAAKRRGLPLPRMVNVGIGFDALHPPSLRTDQILVLAGTAPHKRTRLALDYMARWQRESTFAGTVHWVGKISSSLSLPEFANWRHHPRLPQPEFDQLIQGSRVLVFFSDYEGFGMPPVEAVLRGVCPVYSDIEATREVMNGAGCPFDNQSYNSFIHALRAALTVSPNQIETWKQALASRFNWANVRARIVEALTTETPR